MPVYKIANPYRASTGSMPAPILKTNNNRNALTGHYVDQCSSCGSSYSDEHTIPLNTPFATPPALGNIPRAESRRVSHSSDQRPVVVSANHPTPTSLPPPGQVLHRYQNGALVYEPASSMPPRKERRERRNSVSSSQPRSYNHHQHHQESRHNHRHGHGAAGEWHNYQHEIDIRDEKHGVRGKTTIPRRLVNKEALHESGLPWEEQEGTGALVVFRALSRHDIEKLVHRTESLRARRKEKVVRIIPEPTQTIVHHSGSSHTEDSRRTQEKIIRAEERAHEANEKARKKEYRAEVTGTYIDGIKARKARSEADQKAREAEEIIIKERRRREEREKSYAHGSSSVRVGKTPRDVVIVR